MNLWLRRRELRKGAVGCTGGEGPSESRVLMGRCRGEFGVFKDTHETEVRIVGFSVSGAVSELESCG